MFIAVLARRLKPGKTYEDFIQAWYPDKGFGFGGRGPIVARNIVDDGDILTLGFVDLPDRDSLRQALARVTEQEAIRHDRIAEVIESTTIRAVYEVTDEFDFSTDEAVARGRPQSGP